MDLPCSLWGRTANFELGRVYVIRMAQLQLDPEKDGLLNANVPCKLVIYPLNVCTFNQHCKILNVKLFVIILTLVIIPCHYDGSCYRI